MDTTHFSLPQISCVSAGALGPDIGTLHYDVYAGFLNKCDMDTFYYFDGYTGDTCIPYEVRQIRRSLANQISLGLNPFALLLRLPPPLPPSCCLQTNYPQMHESALFKYSGDGHVRAPPPAWTHTDPHRPSPPSLLLLLCQGVGVYAKLYAASKKCQGAKTKVAMSNACEGNNQWLYYYYSNNAN